MSLSANPLPHKTREFQNHHFDSTIWNDFEFRDDDIIIATYAKSGTTWMQQIISQLLYDGAEGIDVAERSPWVDMRVPPKSEKLASINAQQGRRFLKTHLWSDALVFSEKARYLYIARDGRDVLWSMYNHHSKANDKWYAELNDTPGRVGPPIERPVGDVVQYFHEWLQRDGYPWWPFWSHIRSWWAIRDLPNVKLVHFNQLKADLPGMIEDIAGFLQIPINPQHWQDIVDHCQFDYLRNQGAGTIPHGGEFWDGGVKTFFNKGSNGRWRERLSAADIRLYEQRAEQELGSECARWLATGGVPALSET
ncbi:sulfotransferase domain-containing protein [Oceanobacter mangrovi]|uniref:sulfotransferase domain-containing protein n=1 Tax=Oceanobacter mangrovi TaxID=2862510 RepID=UPI001C8D8271|nr:sulfotransferase domain-containing protein [Oceanobacter mangrovi]